jgi:hypothetical protein
MEGINTLRTEDGCRDPTKKHQWHLQVWSIWATGKSLLGAIVVVRHRFIGVMLAACLECMFSGGGCAGSPDGMENETSRSSGYLLAKQSQENYGIVCILGISRWHRPVSST